MNVYMDKSFEREFEADLEKALVMTAEAVRGDLRNSQTLPRDTGQLTEQTFVDTSKARRGIVSVVSSTPYARRLYFHPEYHFRTDKNRFAGGLWFEPYIRGAKRKWVEQVFARFSGGGNA